MGGEHDRVNPVVPVEGGTYRQRLVVYVVWHPEFPACAALARRVYDHLTRDSQQTAQCDDSPSHCLACAIQLGR